jgi:hypothetical protein
VNSPNTDTVKFNDLSRASTKKTWQQFLTRANHEPYIVSTLTMIVMFENEVNMYVVIYLHPGVILRSELSSFAVKLPVQSTESQDTVLRPPRTQIIALIMQVKLSQQQRHDLSRICSMHNLQLHNLQLLVVLSIVNSTPYATKLVALAMKLCHMHIIGWFLYWYRACTVVADSEFLCKDLLVWVVVPSRPGESLYFFCSRFDTHEPGTLASREWPVLNQLDEMGTIKRK